MDHIGRGWTFPPRFNRYTQTVDMATTAQEEIEQSLRVLFSTHENERLFNNDFGCSVEKYKFQSPNSVHVGRIRKTLEEAIDEFETRITVEKLDVDTERLTEGILLVSVTYSINETTETHTMVYPYNFE